MSDALTPDDLILKAEALAEEPRQVWVVASNDYPHSAFDTQEDAEAFAEGKNKEDIEKTGGKQQRIYYHVHAVPFAASRTLVPDLASALREAGEKNAGTEKAIAAKGGTEHYPTADAYEAACAALEKHRDRADAAESALAAANRRINGLVETLKTIAEHSPYCAVFDLQAVARAALASTPAPAQAPIPNDLHPLDVFRDKPRSEE